MVQPLNVSIHEYRAIFEDSDEESGNIDGNNSDIDFEGIKEDAEESDGDNDHVVFDNFFSSPIRLDHLLDQQTYTCSTVQCTRKDLPLCAKNKFHQPSTEEPPTNPSTG